ncbi:MAG TPA: PKD domain-containing protein, partial [Bacteroidia bacterium]|nr:PKD domain-containing protein [Bacteroidia bacterium]
GSTGTTAGANTGGTDPGSNNNGAGINPVPPAPATQPNTSPGRNDAGISAPDKPADKTTVALYVSDSKLCVKEDVTITLADDISKYTYRVNFGDGTSALTAKGKQIRHKYSKGGIYKITATDITGTREATEQTVEVSKVKAGFIVENVEKAIFKFTNTSEGATQYSWFFGDGKEGSNMASPVYAYTSLDAAEYKVKLIAISENGCVDSFSQRVKQTYTYEDVKPIIPNVFSPNGDGINDRYDIGIRNEELYHLEILDRSGNKVFESFSKENTWDGKNIFTGEECPADAYMMVFVYKIKGFEEKRVTGAVSIKR